MKVKTLEMVDVLKIVGGTTLLFSMCVLVMLIATG